MRMRLAGIVLGLYAMAASASTVPYVTTNIILRAQPASGSYTGNITWGGAFNNLNVGSTESQGAGPFGGTVSFTNASNSSAASASVSGTVNGGFSSGQVHLGSFATVNTINVGSSTIVSAAADSEFVDDLDVSGLKTGTPYIMDFDFDLSGMASATAGARSYVDVIVRVENLGSGTGATWWDRLTAGGIISTASPDNTGNSPQGLTYERVNTNDTTLLTIQLDAYTDLTTGSTVSATSDFLHTLDLTSSSLRDSGGNVISGALKDTSGNSFTAAPEPSCFLLCFAAIGSLCLIRYKC